jgi:hypothetical protein
MVFMITICKIDFLDNYLQILTYTRILINSLNKNQKISLEIFNLNN